MAHTSNRSHVMVGPAELTRADAVRELLLTHDAWLQRRVETIDVLSHELVRRRVSVDVQLGEPHATALASAGGTWIPVATLRKAPLRNFDLAGPSGAAIPAVTKRDNGELAYQVLLEQVRHVLAAQGLRSPSPSPALRRDLRLVATASPDVAARRLVRLRQFAEAGDDETGLLLGDDDTSYLLRLLADNYVLLAVVHDPQPRFLLKMSYDHELEVAKPALSQRLGFAPLLAQIGTPGAAGGASYHAEVVIPEELRVAAAVLFDEVSGVPYAVDEDTDRAAVYASGVPRDAAPTLLIGIRPERAGFPMTAAWLSAAITAILAAGAVGATLDPRSSGPAATVLLAGSALFSGAVARAGEHRLVRTLFAVPRFLLAAPAASALAAATSLALQGSDDVVRVIWAVGALVSALASATLAIAARRAAPLRRSHKVGLEL